MEDSIHQRVRAIADDPSTSMTHADGEQLLSDIFAYAAKVEDRARKR